MRMRVIAGFFSALIAGVVGSSATAWAINYSGFLQNSSGALLSGITVYQTENAAVQSNPSLGDGSFTVPGLPSGTDFSLKFGDTNSSPTYADGYSRNFNRTTSASGSTFVVYRPAEISEWYNNTVPSVSQIPNGGSIRGRIIDADTDANIGGAKVTYTSLLGNTYPVYYYNGTTLKYVAGQATFANGRYMIFNVADGDTVTVTATKTDWKFFPATFNTHSGTLNVSVGNILGKKQTVYLPLILGN